VVTLALHPAGSKLIAGVLRGVSEGEGSTPWYQPMEGRHGMLGNVLFRLPQGRRAMVAGAKLAEMVRFFPKGTAEVFRFMDWTADAYVEGGKTGIFTPLYCFLARKPE
ncbi:MAG: hypothetical protein F4Z43_07990, partial [Rhodothermaceae bacterium]|nr:hypothetical protein [Rhodothermaceae bacterium]